MKRLLILLALVPMAAFAANTVVLDDATQTLTNKTIDTASNTVIVNADHIDTIAEIAAALRTGDGLKLVTGTAGAAGECAEWDASGNLVTSGGACATTLGAELTRSTTQTINNDTATVVLWDTEVRDDGGLHSTVTNTGRITIPTGGDGYWVVTAYLRYSADSAGTRLVNFAVNGGASITTDFRNAAAAGDTGITVSLVLYLAATDYVEAIAYQNSGSNLTIAAASRFQAARVSAP